MVALQALGHHGWRTLGRTRTRASGRFRVSYIPRRLGSERVRLRFAGSAEDSAAHRRLGALNVYRLAEASWYGGGGEPGVRRDVDERDDGRREQDAAVWHAGHAPL